MYILIKSYALEEVKHFNGSIVMACKGTITTYGGLNQQLKLQHLPKNEQSLK
jgi:hypothetical protein